MTGKEAETAYEIVHGTTQHFPDVEAFIGILNTVTRDVTPIAPGPPVTATTGTGVGSPMGSEANFASFFESDEELFITRAPGRLDVMGGIADYSGSLVLQLPLAEATIVALQLDVSRTLTVISQMDANRNLAFTMPFTSLEDDGRLLPYEIVRAGFRREPQHLWAAYVAGVFLVLMREHGVRFEQGARLFIASNVPQGKGVSSSAAVEVAVMSAVAAAFNLELGAQELALLCQTVENQVVGAPCGVMDQMTAACGETDRLLALLCQPAQVLGHIPLPHDVRVWGLDSGVRHSVAGSDYGSVRTGAFMGYRMIADMAGLRVVQTDPASPIVTVVDDRWGGYLANLTPAEFDQHFADHLPERITGAEFLNDYTGTTDGVTQIDPTRTYPVRQPAAHAVYESSRVRAFAELLDKPASEQRRTMLGELMYQSHESYSACGLGSPETDLLVRLVREAGPSLGLYGAKITGGGSGGTVAVLGRRDAEASVTAVAGAFADEMKHQCAIFSGSSPGSSNFGFLKLKLKRKS